MPKGKRISMKFENFLWELICHELPFLDFGKTSDFTGSRPGVHISNGTCSIFHHYKSDSAELKYRLDS